MPSPQQFPEAAAALRARELMPTTLASHELEQLDQDLLARSFFMARVADAEILQFVKDQVDRLTLGPSGHRLEYSNPTEARTRIKEFLAQIDYKPAEGDEGTIKDLRTNRRLNLVIDMNTRMASGYAHYRAGLEPDALRQFPALEFLRIHKRRVPRGYVTLHGALLEVTPHYWMSQWRAAGGKLYGGRMIAPKGDPIWTAISRFGLPYGPPDFGSGYGQLPVSAAECKKLGVPINTTVAQKPVGRDSVEPSPSASSSAHLWKSVSSVDKSPRFNPPGAEASAVPDAPPDVLEIFLAKVRDVARRDGDVMRWTGANLRRAA
jgi:hypothetical protein